MAGLPVWPQIVPEAAQVVQVPLTQRLPAEQGEPAPHWQTPAALQVSANWELQAVQVAPGAPQWASDGVTQLTGLVVVSQQPEQVCALQMQVPPLQIVPTGQITPLTWLTQPA